MLSFRKFSTLMLCLALAAAALGAKKGGGDKGDKVDKAGKAGQDKGTPGATPDPSASRLSLPLNVGSPAKVLKIPYYSEDGSLQMAFSIGEALKTDEDHVDLKVTQVETYNDEEDVDMTIDMPVSTLNLSTRVIASHTPATITRQDFKVTGDSVEFDTVNKIGKLVGNVRMLIYNAQVKEEQQAPAATGPTSPKEAFTPAVPFAVPPAPVIPPPTPFRK